MKYLIILSLIFTGCSESHKFQVGDCLAYTPNDEVWENKADDSPYRVLEIGKKSYHIDMWNKYRNRFDPAAIPSVSFYSEYSYTKVECPK